MSVGTLILVVAILGILMIRVGVRVFGRYLERGFGRGQHPRLEGEGDRRIGRVFPPKSPPEPVAIESAASARDRPAPFGPEESPNPFGE